jgi:serine/threonine-protein kinase
MPADMVLGLGVQLLSALCTARDQWTKAIDLRIPERAKLLSVVYGGLTPDNVTLGVSGDLIVTDIGLSGVAVTTKGIGAQPDVLAYRAPEQFAANSPVDERADVFSVGIMLWELITGQALFRDQRSFERSSGNPSAAAQVTERVCKAELPKLDAGRARVPGQLMGLLKKAVAREVANRFQTLEAMLGALHSLDNKYFASNDEIGQFVANLAREKIAARRAAVLLVSGESDSQPPTSSRPTKRPQKPERILAGAASQVPKVGLKPASVHAKVRASFPEHEAPTVRRPAPMEDDYLGSMLAAEEPTIPRTSAKPHLPAPPKAPRPPSAAIPPPPSAILSPVAAEPTPPPELNGAREPSQSLSPAEGSIRKVEPRRTTLVIAGTAALVLGAILGITALLLRSGPEPKESSVANATKPKVEKVEKVEPRTEPVAEAEVKEQAAPTEPVAAESEPAAEEAAPQDAGPAENTEDQDPAAADPDRRPVRPAAPRSKPHKAFRPSGI